MRSAYLCIRLLDRGGRVVYGRSGPIVHLPDSRRDSTHSNYYAVRNLFLFDYWYTPQPYLVPRLLIDAAQVALHPTRWQARLMRWLFVAAAPFIVMRYALRRRPVSRATYLRFRARRPVRASCPSGPRTTCPPRWSAPPPARAGYERTGPRMIDSPLLPVEQTPARPSRRRPRLGRLAVLLGVLLVVAVVHAPLLRGLAGLLVVRPTSMAPGYVWIASGDDAACDGDRAVQVAADYCRRQPHARVLTIDRALTRSVELHA